MLLQIRELYDIQMEKSIVLAKSLLASRLNYDGLAQRCLTQNQRDTKRKQMSSRLFATSSIIADGKRGGIPQGALLAAGDPVHPGQGRA